MKFILLNLYPLKIIINKQLAKFFCLGTFWVKSIRSFFGNGCRFA